MVGTSFFKVGKVGPKRKARWTTHHYKQDKARSTLAKSILAHNGILKSQYPQKKHIEIDGISNENIANWIKNNMFRIEFVIKSDENPFELNLLEALAQFYLNPIFEGRKLNLQKQ